jgi:hypothetical protein
MAASATTMSIFSNSCSMRSAAPRSGFDVADIGSYRHAFTAVGADLTFGSGEVLRRGGLRIGGGRNGTAEIENCRVRAIRRHLNGDRAAEPRSTAYSRGESEYQVSTPFPLEGTPTPTYTVCRRLQRPTIIRPVEERLPLTRAAERISRLTISLDLMNVPTKCFPAVDLAPILIRNAAAEIVAAIPLEPSAWVVRVNPALRPPL